MSNTITRQQEKADTQRAAFEFITAKTKGRLSRKERRQEAKMAARAFKEQRKQ